MARKVRRGTRAWTCLAICWNAFDDRQGSAHFANPDEKRAVARLEKLGLVTVERPGTMCAGYEEWYATLTRRGVLYYDPMSALVAWASVGCEPELGL